MPTVRIIGPGRAGRSLAAAIAALDEWTVAGLLGRHDDPTDAAAGVDLLVLATPDRVVAEVAASVTPGRAVVAHLAGSLGLDVLAPHDRRGAFHPLMSLPDEHVGAVRLQGGWFAVAGHALVADLVASLGGRTFTIADDDRAVYHAAAAIASNHLVALLGHAVRVGEAAGAPPDALLELALGSADNAARLGPAAALTGPAARGDDVTVGRHLSALAERLPDEVDTYRALLAEARRLAGVERP